MKQMTLRGLDDQLAGRIKNVAAERGMSVNRTILTLLRELLGLVPAGVTRDHLHSDLDGLAGTWSSSEARHFDERLKEQRAIDAALWR